MKPSQKGNQDASIDQTPSQGSLGTSMSSKPLCRVLDDMEVPDGP